MTTKEIAEAVGKDISTVQRWVKKMNGKMQSIDGKMQSSTSTNPADFTYEETLAIIEHGMGKNAAGVYRMNAKSRNPETSDIVTRSDLAVFGAAIVSEMMKQFMPLLQNPVKQIGFIQDYFSIKGYASKLGQQIAFSEALTLGRLAGKISREKGIEIRKVDDEQYGEVNSYSIEVLKEVFQI